MGNRGQSVHRIERLYLLHWPPDELIARLGLPRAKAADHAVTHGCYPGASALRRDERHCRRYVLDSIVEPAIGRDILATEAVRKSAMLRQVFAVAASHSAQVISLQKLQGALSEPGSLATVSHDLRLLEEAGLVAAVPKYFRHVVRQRAAPPKLVVLNNALLGLGGSAMPDPKTEPERWGRWVENACMALAWHAGQRLWYWR